MRLIRIFLLLVVMLSAQVVRASRVRKIFAISPALECSALRPAASTQLPGFSFTQKHLYKDLCEHYFSENQRCDHEDVANHINTHIFLNTRIFHSQNPGRTDAIEAYAHMALKSIGLEKQFAHSHFPFFHGTASTKFILLRTMLEQLKRKQQCKNFFLLRNKGATDHLKNVTSGYEYVMKKINSVYAAQGSLGRFDNNDPVASDMLAVNAALFANIGIGGEDSVSFLRCPSLILRLEPKIKECFYSYGLSTLFSELPIYLQESLKEPLGSTLAIFIPKKFSRLVYTSQPFGIPLGLPQMDLRFSPDLHIRVGRTSLGDKLFAQHVKEKLEKHAEVRIDDCFARQELFDQARIVLNPRYFENPESGIKMFMFVWQNEKNIQFLLDDFKFIASLAQKMIGSS